MKSAKGDPIKYKRLDSHLWEIEARGNMRVPGRLYISEQMLDSVRSDGGAGQVINVASLPGIVGYSLAMPDIHWGYGFPIGGVAATDPAAGGVISPGGVGYDINCGVRVITTSLSYQDIRKRLGRMLDSIFAAVPTGVGSSGAIRRMSRNELSSVLTGGANWAVDEGFGSRSDLANTEESGCLVGADPSLISDRAFKRGADQVGTLGSGNHFIEINRVTDIFHPKAASEFDLHQDQIVIQIHTGSRGFGHQVCDDYLKVMARAVRKYEIELPDRQLCCAPVNSAEGQAYLGAMACAANYAWANRQVIMALVERALTGSGGIPPRDLNPRLLYDVCHNIAKLEDHEVDGEARSLCVHRKGATRAYPPPGAADPWQTGQPVLVPGDMGTESYICVGQKKSLSCTWGSTCHGAGRLMSRRQAMKSGRGRDLVGELKNRGVEILAKNTGTIAEEMSEAYKDVRAVVEVMDTMGISLKVARLIPLAVIKG